MSIYYTEIDSPLGQLVIRGDAQFVTGLFMSRQKGWQGPDATWKRSDTRLLAACEQLTEYFAGERQQFDLPIKLTGTSFQQRVWQELVRIPFGTTITYAELARRIGQPTASRAVGHANSLNPVGIIVPCHRVIGANGKLTGYAGGLDKKQWLLAWEHSVTPSERRDLFDAAGLSFDDSKDRRLPSVSVSSIES